MTSTFQNLIINTLPELTFVAGGYQELNFYVYNTAGSPINITTASCSWALSPYGQSNYAVLEKSGSIVISGSITNRFTVAINSEDTTYLGGKYLQQPIVISVPGFEYRQDQGIVTIIPKVFVG